MRTSFVQAFVRLTMILKGLPLTYGKDMQDDKPAIFEAADAIELSLAAMAGMIADMKANPRRYVRLSIF